MSIRIILCDDHRIVREGLRSLLKKEKDMAVVGECVNGIEACHKVRECSPDVVVMDVAMPNLNGIAASRRIQNESPSTRILALSMHSDRQFVAGMLQAGAAGYLLKDCAFPELITAIRTIADGGMYISPKIAGNVMAELAHRDKPSRKQVKPELSDREEEILQLISEGKSTKSIAKSLSLSIKTIETHRKNIMGKLKVNSVAALTKYAIRAGLTTVEG